MKYISLREQLINERRKNALVTAAQMQDAANIEYIAMMCDIELDADAEEEFAEYNEINNDSSIESEFDEDENNDDEEDSEDESELDEEE